MVSNDSKSSNSARNRKKIASDMPENIKISAENGGFRRLSAVTAVQPPFFQFFIQTPSILRNLKKNQIVIIKNAPAMACPNFFNTKQHTFPPLVGEEHHEVEHQIEQPQGALYPVLQPLRWPGYQPTANASAHKQEQLSILFILANWIVLWAHLAYIFLALDIILSPTIS